VERIIPSYIFHPFGIAVPPIEGDVSLSVYSISAGDMTHLVELYGLELEQGHLPAPNTNGIVIPKVAAQNRKLKVGDVIGTRDYPIYKNAPALPSELVVSGIFASAATPETENWLGFMSLEFVDDYQEHWNTDLSFLVVPKAGQKDVLDDWLESEIGDGVKINVMTYRRVLAKNQEKMRTMITIITLMESLMAVVAAIALAGLNYLFISQRQSEFGVLNALGFNRLQLVWRTVRETAFTAGIAWVLSAILCSIALLCLLFGLFTPLGLRINFLNPIPWLYTLPVPIAVVTVTGGTTAWTLSKLDPVSVIERR
jgi:ABC-type antimicrobial peptide transport system permease subunit